MIYFERILHVAHIGSFVWMVGFSLWFAGLIGLEIYGGNGFDGSEAAEVLAVILVVGAGPYLTVLFLQYVIKGKIKAYPF